MLNKFFFICEILRKKNQIFKGLKKLKKLSTLLALLDPLKYKVAPRSDFVQKLKLNENSYQLLVQFVIFDHLGPLFRENLCNIMSEYKSKNVPMSP